MTTTERANRAVVRDMIERKRGGFYDPVYNYDIGGDYVNCDVSASALGAQAVSTLTAPTGTAEFASNASMSADSTANASDARFDGGFTSISQFQSISEADRLERPDATSPWSAAGGDATQDVMQGAEGSTQQATVSGSVQSSEAGSVSSSGAVSNVALNSSQSNENSPLNASVVDSLACAFTELTGSGGSTVTASGR